MNKKNGDKKREQKLTKGNKGMKQKDKEKRKKSVRENNKECADLRN